MLLSHSPLSSSVGTALAMPRGAAPKRIGESDTVLPLEVVRNALSQIAKALEYRLSTQFEGVAVEQCTVKRTVVLRELATSCGPMSAVGRVWKRTCDECVTAGDALAKLLDRHHSR